MFIHERLVLLLQANLEMLVFLQAMIKSKSSIIMAQSPRHPWILRRYQRKSDHAFSVVVSRHRFPSLLQGSKQTLAELYWCWRNFAAHPGIIRQTHTQSLNWLTVKCVNWPMQDSQCSMTNTPSGLPRKNPSCYQKPPIILTIQVLASFWNTAVNSQ